MKIIKFKNEVQTNNLSEMKTLIRFFAFEDCFRREDLDKLKNEDFSKINDFIEKFAKECKTSENNYKLSWNDDLIIVHPN